MVFSSNARMIIKEVVSIMADVKETVFFSDGATIQFKNRYLIEYLMMMEVNDLGISWNYFASSHGKRVVDGVGGTLKRLMFGTLQPKSSSTHVTGKRQQRLFNSYNKLNSMGKKYHLSVLFRRLYVYQIFSNIIMWMTGIGMLLAMLDIQPVRKNMFSDFKHFTHHITSSSIKTFVCSPCAYPNRSFFTVTRIYSVSYDERLLFFGNIELAKWRLHAKKWFRHKVFVIV